MQSQSKEYAASSFSCTQCRSKKLKCDRSRPSCGRCARFDGDCEYPQTRRLVVGRRQRVQELEVKLDNLARLARPDHNATQALDQQAGQSNRDPSGETFVTSLAPVPATSLSDATLVEVETLSGLIQTGLFEQRPSPAMVEFLTQSYFDKWHYTAPMIHHTSYLVSLDRPPHSGGPPMCLRYIIMAWGAEMVNTHRSLALPFYKRARVYAETDELQTSNTLAHAQTWCLICYFEAQYLLFTQSSMSICRAIRIGQIIGLHRIDELGDDDDVFLLPLPWLELEERRRTWWALFCSDRLVGGTAGWPVLIREHDISTRLPSSDAAFELGFEETTSTLMTALNQSEPIYSPFAGRVLAASLFHEAFQHSNRLVSNEELDDPRTSPYWKRHREIDNDLAILIQTLPDGLRLPKQIRCQNAIFVNAIIQTAIICLHRAALSKLKTSGLHEGMVRSSRSRLDCAAEAILDTFRMMSDTNENLKNTILVHSVYVASQVFLDDSSYPEENHLRQDNLDFILRIITLSAKAMNNPVTGSLAVQIALEMRIRGLNSVAVEQAMELPLSRSLIPIFVKGGDPSSSFVFQLASTSATPDET
ncbi:binuclear zinc transcription factor [Plectosphaerella plurivora]|uniref:Binuclear zinc transcription factor n=1 Tax=Plectosphaerella plurivora TaxID=936078 RepID=A0A9P9A6L6_9PEZI|nr:binuclear zinc transcription factor [Plectosphaerella plurivora]